MVFGFSIRMMTNDDGFSQLDEDQSTLLSSQDRRGKASLFFWGKGGMSSSSSSWPLVSFLMKKKVVSFLP
jgi:hypothetical protein